MSFIRKSKKIINGVEITLLKKDIIEETKTSTIASDVDLSGVYDRLDYIENIFGRQTGLEDVGDIVLSFDGLALPKIEDGGTGVVWGNQTSGFFVNVEDLDMIFSMFGVGSTFLWQNVDGRILASLNEYGIFRANILDSESLITNSITLNGDDLILYIEENVQNLFNQALAGGIVADIIKATSFQAPINTNQGQSAGGYFFNSLSNDPYDGYAIKYSTNNAANGNYGYHYGRVQDYAMRFTSGGDITLPRGFTWTMVGYPSWENNGYRPVMSLDVDGHLTLRDTLTIEMFSGKTSENLITFSSGLEQSTTKDKWILSYDEGTSGMVISNTLELPTIRAEGNLSVNYQGSSTVPKIYFGNVFNGFVSPGSTSLSYITSDFLVPTEMPNNSFMFSRQLGLYDGASWYGSSALTFTSIANKTKYIDMDISVGGEILDDPDWWFDPADVYSDVNLGIQDHTIFWDEKKNRYHIIGIRQGYGATGARSFVWCVSDSLSANTFQQMTGGSELDGFIVSLTGANVGGYQVDTVWAPHLIEHDGFYYLFYTGVENPNVGVNNDPYNAQRIFVAISNDVDNWNASNISINYLFDGSILPESTWNIPGQWTGDCRDPFVIKNNNSWAMTYSTRLYGDHVNTPNFVDNPMAIAIVTSTTLTGDWQNAGWIRATASGETGGEDTWEGTAESPNVFKGQDNKYYLFQSWGPSFYAGNVRLYSSSTLLNTGSTGYKRITNLDEVANGIVGFANDIVQHPRLSNTWLYTTLRDSPYKISMDKAIQFTGVSNGSISWATHSAYTQDYYSGYLPQVLFNRTGADSELIGDTLNALTYMDDDERFEFDDSLNVRGQIFSGGVDISTLMGGGSGADAETDADITASLEVGGIEAGELIPAGTSFSDFVRDLLVMTFYPTITNPSQSLTTDASVNNECGEILNVLLTMNFDRGSINGDLVGGIWNPAVAQDYRAGTANNYEISGTNVTPPTTTLTVNNYTVEFGTNTFTGTTSYNQGPQPYDSDGNNWSIPAVASTISPVAVRNIYGRRRSFYGGTTDTTAYSTSSQIRALPSNTLLTSVSSISNFNINIDIGDTMVTFAYPSSYGEVTSVIYVEGLNADITDIFNRTTVSVEGVNSYAAVNYYVYTYIPAEPFADTATYTVDV